MDQTERTLLYRNRNGKPLYSLHRTAEKRQAFTKQGYFGIVLCKGYNYPLKAFKGHTRACMSVYGRFKRHIRKSTAVSWSSQGGYISVLGYSDTAKAIRVHVDEEDLSFNESLKLSRQSGAWLINESGLYSLILSSKLPKAKELKRLYLREYRSKYQQRHFSISSCRYPFHHSGKTCFIYPLEVSEQVRPTRKNQNRKSRCTLSVQYQNEVSQKNLYRF